MSIGLILAALLGVYVVVLLVRGRWSDRIGVVAAVGFGLLIPQILAAIAGVAGSAASLFSATGW
jgi:hypothetical protein